MGSRLSEDGLQEALDSRGGLFASVNPGGRCAAQKVLVERLKGQTAENYDPEITNLKFLDVNAPPTDPRMINKFVQR